MDTEDVHLIDNLSQYIKSTAWFSHAFNIQSQKVCSFNVLFTSGLEDIAPFMILRLRLLCFKNKEKLVEVTETECVFTGGANILHTPTDIASYVYKQITESGAARLRIDVPFFPDKKNIAIGFITYISSPFDSMPYGTSTTLALDIIEYPRE